jgi:hypothetical protein
MVLPAPSPHRAGAQLARECRPRVEAGGLQPRGSARQLMRYAASWRAEAGTEVPVLAVAAIGVSSKRAPTRWLVQLVQHRALCLAVTAAAQSGVAVSSPGTIYATTRTPLARAKGCSSAATKPRNALGMET